jgi:hypothetical protein
MLYTIGYSGWILPVLQQTVTDRGAALVDIRYRAWSWPYSEWRKSHLQQSFGTRYVHIPALGNRNYKTKGAPIALAAYPTGQRQVAQLLRMWPVLVLLCGCAALAGCHRVLVADRLCQDLQEVVVHLTCPSGENISYAAIP